MLALPLSPHKNLTRAVKPISGIGRQHHAAYYPLHADNITRCKFFVLVHVRHDYNIIVSRIILFVLYSSFLSLLFQAIVDLLLDLSNCLFARCHKKRRPSRELDINKSGCISIGEFGLCDDKLLKLLLVVVVMLMVRWHHHRPPAPASFQVFTEVVCLSPLSMAVCLPLRGSCVPLLLSSAPQQRNLRKKPHLFLVLAF